MPHGAIGEEGKYIIQKNYHGDDRYTQPVILHQQEYGKRSEYMSPASPQKTQRIEKPVLTVNHYSPFFGDGAI